MGMADAVAVWQAVLAAARRWPAPRCRLLTSQFSRRPYHPRCMPRDSTPAQQYKDIVARAPPDDDMDMDQAPDGGHDAKAASATDDTSPHAHQ